MHPGCLVFVLLLEDGVCDGEVMFQTQTEQSHAIGVGLSNAVSANHPVPPYSHIKITKQYYFVASWTMIKGLIECLIEAFFLLITGW